MASAYLLPVRQQIAAVIGGLSPSVKTYTYPPGLAGLDSLPCAVIELPGITRTDPDRKDSEFGRADWRQDWSVLFFFDLAQAEYAVTQAEETVEDFIKAVDARTNADLDSATILDWKVTSAQYSALEERSRALLVYDTTLAVWQLVP